MSAVELHHASRRRGTGPHAVQALLDATLVVNPGEVVLIEGPSGAGKTTLLAVAAGLLTPDLGEVILAGRRLTGTSRRWRRGFRARKVGFVFQRANLLAGLTVFENVLLQADIAGLARREGRRETSRILAELGLEQLAGRRADSLSGGEEHRVGVGRALVHRPEVVFADEPTGNLDSASGRAVAEALARHGAEHGLAVLVASHDPRLHPYATRRVRMLDGILNADNG